jgi:hypothetical protein
MFLNEIAEQRRNDEKNERKNNNNRLDNSRSSNDTWHLYAQWLDDVREKFWHLRR